MAQPIRIGHRPTFKYSRIVWNGNTFDFPDALISAVPETSPVVGSAIAASGARQTVFEHIESAVTVVTPIMDAVATDQMERFFRDWGEQGNQFEFYLDTHLRAYWGFQQHLKDNNLANPFAITGPDGVDTGELPTYVLAFSVPTSTGLTAYGVTVPTASNRALRANLVNPLNPLNSFVSTSATEGGMLALVFKPSFNFSDSAEHYLVDLTAPGSPGSNRLTIVKAADNVLRLSYTGGNGSETILASSTSWVSGDEVTLLAQWGALSDLKLSAQGVTVTTQTYTIRYGGGNLYGTGLKYGQTTGTPSGSEQAFSAAPTRATLGADDAMLGGRLVGSIGLFSLYRGLYGTLDNSLGTYRYPWKTYYPRAELADAAFRATRFTPSRELYTYQLRIRDGV
jgi:hypothetical protein